MDCYILWDMKKLILFKFLIAAKKILIILNVNPLGCCTNEKTVLIKYVERKIFALEEDNRMMGLYLKNQKNLELSSPKLTYKLFNGFKIRNRCEEEIEEIAGNIKNISKESGQENAIDNSEIKLLKI